ncbi:MAG: cupin domain-containing protein [Anaerolineae bacterium]|nr:cupin domain-containing protein [Anaerolineae bacterium]
MEKVNEANLPFRGGESGVKYLFRGPQVDWGVILLRPGERLGAHYHEQVEETFFLLHGRVTLLADGQEVPLVPGDAVRLPAPERHDLQNEGEEAAKLVFIKCPYLPKDKVDLA